MIEIHLVDSLNSGFGVRVGGQQHPLRIGKQRPCSSKELCALHVWHALVGEEECDRVSPAFELLGRFEGLRPRRGTDDPVVGRVFSSKVSPHCREDLRVVVDGQNRRLRHCSLYPPGPCRMLLGAVYPRKRTHP